MRPSLSPRSFRASSSSSRRPPKASATSSALSMRQSSWPYSRSAPPFSRRRHRCRHVHVSRAAFNRLLDKFPELERWLFEFTVRELDISRDWTLMLRRSPYERVASLLLIIARRARNAGCQPVPTKPLTWLPLTRSELADYLGLTLETVSRKSAVSNARASSSFADPQDCGA